MGRGGFPPTVGTEFAVTEVVGHDEDQVRAHGRRRIGGEEITLHHQLDKYDAE